MKQKINKPIFILTVLAIAVGFLLSVTYKTLAPYNTPETVNNEYQTLTDFIIELEEKNAATEAEIIGLRSHISEVQSEQAAEEGVLISLQKRLTVLALEAGYVEAGGRGLVITLDDNDAAAALAQKNSPETYKAENYIIHDSDLLYILRALSRYTEGAAINGQRITDTSHIRCVGTVIMVNSARLAPPYVISLVGNPETLLAALNGSGTYLYLTQIKDMPITVAVAEDIILPASSSSFTLTYTKASETIE